MKTYLTYGAMIAAANALLMLLLFLLGFHSAEKFLLGMILQFCAGMIILVIGLVRGMRAKRAENGPLGLPYGKALVTGIMITVFSTVIGVVFNVVYTKLINTGYEAAAVEWTVGMLEKAGADSVKIDEVREQAAAGQTVTRNIINGLIGGMVFGTLVSLIVAAFVKRPPSEPPMVPST